MTTYTVNGQRIFARVEGPASGQVALLVHGWSSSWYALSPLLPDLSRRFRCVALDLPGYGNSAPLPARASIDGYADLLAALAVQLSDGPVVLVGHSMGGMISLTLALRHPRLVERLVLLSPTISGHLSTYISLFISPITMLERHPLANRLVAALEPGFLNITDRLMRPASFAERSDITEQDYRRIRADVRRPGQGRVRAECYWAMRDGDLRGRLGQVEAPALVLWGAEDNTVPLRDAGVVADEWPQADLRIIPKAGHWPQFETPSTARRYVGAFLGLPPAGPRLEETLGQTVAEVGEVAQFLANSDIGDGLSVAQRTRLAAHFTLRIYTPGATVVTADTTGDHLFVIREGSVEVLGGTGEAPSRVATLVAGQIAGELALLDGGRRSADMQAGPEGAVLLALRRERLLALLDDDPELGQRLLWNMAAALALRLRRTTWKAQQAASARVDETP